MNRKLMPLILTGALGATLGLTSLWAASPAVADIPFAFHVQSKLMPAGRYYVESVDQSLTVAISDHASHSRYVTTKGTEKGNPEDPKLTFACSNGEYTLFKVELPGSAESRLVSRPKSEHSLGMASMVSVRVSH